MAPQLRPRSTVAAAVGMPPSRKRKREPDATAQDTTTAPTDKKTFLGIPPEVRNIIYHCLLDGQIIDMADPDRRQDLGLNILLTCKTCLAEAKSLALTSATFKTAKFSLAVKDDYGLGDADLGRIRSLEVHEWVVITSRLIARSRLLKSMPNLCRVTIQREEYGCDRKDDKLQALQLFRFCNLEPLLQHVQKAATRNRERAELVVNWVSYYGKTGVKVEVSCGSNDAAVFCC